MSVESDTILIASGRRPIGEAPPIVVLTLDAYGADYLAELIERTADYPEDAGAVSIAEALREAIEKATEPDGYTVPDSETNGQEP